ncbi:hypothetical protein CPB97_002362 [Podila verticillata]|nr:hypothetical protein CPB97_002362 [Podila verticillata]
MSEDNEFPAHVVAGTNNSSKALESSGNADFLDHVKSVTSSRMECHYLQRYNHHAYPQHQQLHESMTSWPSTTTISTSRSQHSQDLDSQPSTPLSDCSSLDSEDSVPGWRLRKIKAAAEARSVPLPPRSLVRGPRFLTHFQGLALPPRPTHHWTSTIFQAGGTPCCGFQFGTLANEASLDLNFLRAGSSVNETEKSPIADFVSSDRFFQREPSRRMIMEGERVSWDVDSGSEHVDENEKGDSDNESEEDTGRDEAWTVGLWPQVLHRIQKGPLEYLEESWRNEFMDQHVDHDEFENPLCDLEVLGLGTLLEIGTEKHVHTCTCRSSKK